MYSLPHPALKPILQKLTDFPVIHRILLYGSRARGDHKERSDIDIAIDVPALTDRDWFTILEIFEQADSC